MNAGEFLYELERHIEKGEGKEAERMVRDFSRGKEDEFARLLIKEGIILGEIGRHRRALSYFELACAISRSEQIKMLSTKLVASSHNNLGILLIKIGRKEEAEYQFRQAIENRPNFAEAHNNLGTLLKDCGKSEEAEKEFREAIRCKSDLHEARFNLAVLLSEMGMLHELLYADMEFSDRKGSRQ